MTSFWRLTSLSLTLCTALWLFSICAVAFTFIPTGQPCRNFQHACRTPLQPITAVPKVIVIRLDDDDDDDEGLLEDDEDDDDDEEEEDPYTQLASSEFKDATDSENSAAKQSLVRTGLGSSSGAPTTSLDWGGALGKLRQRVDDVESGKSQDPSQALFRLMSSQSPNQAVGSFVSTADPQVVQAMSGAVSSLLGGLSNPMSGAELLVKASGDKIGALCFQLQMTGYMFRNAEYVVALKELMDLRGSATLDDYRDAFDRLDSDNSGYIEANEIEELLDDVYDGKTPAFEITAFLDFFDKNEDGKVSWEEFERGIGSAISNQAQSKANYLKLLPGSSEDEDEESIDLKAEVLGKIEVELGGGKVVEVEAKEYVDSLKKEVESLKEALRREKLGLPSKSSKDALAGKGEDVFGGIASYIASRQGDLKSLTEGISPEIVNAMKLLVDFVLEGGDGQRGKDIPKEEIEMEIPGAALQQLALWQLILGYRLREAEAKGDYLKLLE